MANGLSQFPKLATKIGGRIGAVIGLLTVVITLVLVLGQTTIQIIETYNKSEIPLKTLKSDFEMYKEEQEKLRKKDLLTMQTIADQVYVSTILICKINGGQPNRTWPDCDSVEHLPIKLDKDNKPVGAIYQLKIDYPFKRDLSIDLK